MYNKQLALIECTPNSPTDGCRSLRLLVWGNDDIDDYTDKFTFYVDCSGGEPQEVVWEKHLSYLRTWTEERNGPGFYGTTPMCFTDWHNNVYKEEKVSG